MLEGMDGGMDIGALMAGGAEGGSGQGTITEEQMQQAIADAVAQVKEASAAEKKAAVEAAKQEMMARHEARPQPPLLHLQLIFSSLVTFRSAN